jgi:hypothetical protein
MGDVLLDEGLACCLIFSEFDCQSATVQHPILCLPGVLETVKGISQTLAGP